MGKIVAIVSGGLDSSIMAALLKSQGDDVHMLSIDYGQRHKKELQYATKVAEHLSLEHRVADVSNLKQFLSGSSQTDDLVEVPHGHYADESMKLTVVSNRNMILLSIAGAWAISLKADAIAYGAHAGDHPIYRDCRPEFMNSFQHTLHLADEHRVGFLHPWAFKTKADIVKVGYELNFPFELTWSCYEGGEVHCTKCGTCCERIEAFQLAGVKDPTKYKV